MAKKEIDERRTKGERDSVSVMTPAEYKKKQATYKKELEAGKQKTLIISIPKNKAKEDL